LIPNPSETDYSDTVSPDLASVTFERDSLALEKAKLIRDKENLAAQIKQLKIDHAHELQELRARLDARSSRRSKIQENRPQLAAQPSMLSKVRELNAQLDAQSSRRSKIQENRPQLAARPSMLSKVLELHAQLDA
jgi:chromosome segregation ATPase